MKRTKNQENVSSEKTPGQLLYAMRKVTPEQQREFMRKAIAASAAARSARKREREAAKDAD